MTIGFRQFDYLQSSLRCERHYMFNKRGSQPSSKRVEQAHHFEGWVWDLEVCVPKLVLNQIRQDETGGHFPKWRDRDNTTVFWSHCSEKSGKNNGK